MRTEHVIVEAYNTKWPEELKKIAEEISTVIGVDILNIEHVGSTSVPGLSAKPIIDIDVVMKDYSRFDEIVRKLSSAGYVHEGNLGIKDREAFCYTGKEHLMTHHLYVCPSYSDELKRHISFRDYLKKHPNAVKEYSNIKEEGAKLYPESIEKYAEYKAPIIDAIYKAMQEQLIRC